MITKTSSMNDMLCYYIIGLKKSKHTISGSVTPRLSRYQGKMTHFFQGRYLKNGQSKNQSNLHVNVSYDKVSPQAKRIG